MVNPPFQSPQAQPESGVRGNVPAPFGAGERLQSPTYRYLGGSNPPRLLDPLNLTAGKSNARSRRFAMTVTTVGITKY
jgi:hypothetical protein